MSAIPHFTQVHLLLLYLSHGVTPTKIAQKRAIGELFYRKGDIFATQNR